MSDTIYAIGDIHGQYELLLDALTLVELDGGAEAPLVCVGDLVDRGLGSREVIELLIGGQEAGRDWTVLMGNHDRLFERYLRNGATTHPKLRPGLTWLDERMGGMTTLASYGVDTDQAPEDLLRTAQSAVPKEHLKFLAGLPLYHETDDLLFVHAGLQPRLPLEWQTEDDLLWIRDAFLKHEGSFDKLVIHGHTAVDEAEHHGNRVNIDSGAGFGRALTVVAIEGRDVFALEEDGRKRLTPAAM